MFPRGVGVGGGGGSLERLKIDVSCGHNRYVRLLLVKLVLI